MNIHQIKSFFSVLIFAIILATLYTYASPYDLPAQTKTFYDRHGEIIGTLNPVYNGLQIWTPIEQIPESIILATLKNEDQKFYWHFGINPWSIIKAAITNISAGHVVRGGSTITQQLAKNLIQEHDGKIMTRSFASKLKTTILALSLEMRHSKSWILERYLNSIYYGHRCYGIAAAAQFYFDAALTELNPQDILKLSKLPQSPGRTNRIIPNPKGQSQGFYGRHFIEFLGTTSQTENIIHTTLDLDLQKRLEEGLKNVLQSKLDHDPKITAAGIVIDASSGDVLAMVGSRDYFDASIDGQVNAAVALRQPGSTLKPFTYFAAFAKGMTPDTLINDSPVNFSIVDSDESYAPQNFDHRFRGSVSIREALANSYNVPAVAVLNQIGLSYYHDVLKNFGFTSLTANPEHYGLSVTLGSGEVTLLELTNAYADLARGGYHKPYRLTKSDARTSSRAILPGAAMHSAAITEILMDASARLKTFGYNGSLSIDGFDVAVKTGTSYDLHDNWAIGYSPHLAVGVWVGHADGTPLIDTTGATGAGPIWHAFMEASLRGKKPHSFAFLNPSTLPKIEHERLDPMKNTKRRGWGISQPLNGSHYRLHPYLPKTHQKISAEVTLNGEQLHHLDWYLDGEWLSESELQEQDKIARTWIDPVPGKHVLKIASDDGTEKIVKFSVVDTDF